MNNDFDRKTNTRYSLFALLTQKYIILRKIFSWETLGALGRLLALVSYTKEAVMASQQHKYRILIVIPGKLWHNFSNKAYTLIALARQSYLLVAWSKTFYILLLLHPVVFPCSDPGRASIGGKGPCWAVVIITILLSAKLWIIKT